MKMWLLLLFFPLLMIVGCGPNSKDPVKAPQSTALVSSSKEAIRQVMKASNYICGKCDEDANFFRENFGENEKVARVSKSLKAIDCTRCPQDFQDALVAHIHALERLSRALSDNPAIANLWDRGEISAAPEVKAARASCLDTWQEVERLATSKYGVSLHDLQK